MSDSGNSIAPSDLTEFVRMIRARTPARLLTGRSGSSYRTRTQMELREAHAAARDAVRTDLDPASVLGDSFLEEWQLLEVSTRASSKDEYLLRPDLGRSFIQASREEIQERCPRGANLQIAIGDGLSVTALGIQVPVLLPLLREGAGARGWRIGRTLLIHRCRVGILNEIGEILGPHVVVLLIGERPGLATAESLSAYMAFRPVRKHTDAERNLISNIHSRGVPPTVAAVRILNLAAQMIKAGVSGFSLKEQAPSRLADSE